MAIDAIIAMGVGIAGVVGAFYEGRRRGAVSTTTIANNTVNLLKVQLEAFEADRAEKERVIADLKARVEILEGLVTQRAEVRRMHDDVLGIRTVVDRIDTRLAS